MKAWAKAHPEIGRAKSKRYAAKNKAAIKAKRAAKRALENARNRANYAARAEHFQEYRKRHRETLARTKAKSAAANPAAILAAYAKHRATKRRAMPTWANRGEITAIYRAASSLTRQTGIKHEVDHIVPLSSPVVCGLHWEANLQILTKTANRRKSNRLAA